jgi:hypothetical protein
LHSCILADKWSLILLIICFIFDISICKSIFFHAMHPYHFYISLILPTTAHAFLWPFSATLPKILPLHASFSVLWKSSP